MKSEELRAKYLDFFKKKGHTIIPSASLIPENDPTVLFTTAGMHPLVPFLLGEKHPGGKRLTDAQKCIRTGDIDDVGDDTHLTFFEMLGNWSLGDYWKGEAIGWSFEFLTKELKIPLERLAVTCFEGDSDAPKDEETAKIWEGFGIKKEKIAFLPKADNWWGPAGSTGPCGPDTEMFYWKSEKPAPKVFDPKDKNWVEIWNDVFMQYVKNEKGEYEPAKQKNVDTGMGLERTLVALNGKQSVYETDLFLPIIKKIEELSGVKYTEDMRQTRIIADHIKAASFLLAEGVEPFKEERGYVVRRLIRNAIECGNRLGIKDSFTHKIGSIVIDTYRDVYPEMIKNQKLIEEGLKKEEEAFKKTEKKSVEFFAGTIQLKTKTRKPGIETGTISGRDAFDYYQTHGLSLEKIKELAAAQGFKVDEEGFKEEFKKHQELSRTASAGVFKGGLADASEQTTKLHTAAHLMLAGLRKVLGNDVIQKGSNITAERLRFDFSHKEKLTSEQIKDVENFVNDIIKKDLPVSLEEMTLEKAKELNAMGIFESKYGDRVKVYTVGSGDNAVSREICGGPHVGWTGVLGHFKIIKEESSSSGVRRIKAILE